MTEEPRTKLMSVCAFLGKGMLVAGALAVAAFGFLILLSGLFTTDRGGDFTRLKVRSSLKELKVALEVYESDYHHFPISESASTSSDLSLRSRGPLLSALVGLESEGLNPKDIKFIAPPTARNRKDGLWQDGAEWVLSDHWGEPYYIVLDTNKDLQVPNPEFGAISADPKQAALDLKYPLPEKLPVTVAIYSSGPDRDPNTWQDNICSWRTH